DALSQARKGLRDDIEKTIAALKAKMAREDAKIGARELEELKEFLEKLREQLKTMKGKQDDVSNETERTDTPADVKKAKGKQEDLEEQLKKLLARAKKL